MNTVRLRFLELRLSVELVYYNCKILKGFDYFRTTICTKRARDGSQVPHSDEGARSTAYSPLTPQRIKHDCIEKYVVAAGPLVVLKLMQCFC